MIKLFSHYYWLKIFISSNMFLYKNGKKINHVHMIPSWNNDLHTQPWMVSITVRTLLSHVNLCSSNLYDYLSHQISV